MFTPTFRQLARGNLRLPKLKKKKSRWLEGCPQKRAVCTRVYTMKPKKPNSATRKIAKVGFVSTRKSVTVYIPGQGHKLQQHSLIMVRGGRVKDLPGIHYHAIRGLRDFESKEYFERFQARSKYGIKFFFLTGARSRMFPQNAV